MEKKYVLTNVTTNFRGHTLHRVRATEDFGDVRVGDFGGWIESEKNLSHEGNCWVYDEAKVFDNAEVRGDAKVCDYAYVYDDSMVCDYAYVYGCTEIKGASMVCVYARIGGCLVIENQTITEYADVKPKQEIDDGGERISYGDGMATREPSTGKGRFDLISPFALCRLAKWYELGAAKYSDRNWEKGIPFSRYLDSAMRHLNKFLMGMTDEDHLAAAAWNIFAIMHHQERRETHLNDLPAYMNDKVAE